MSKSLRDFKTAASRKDFLESELKINLNAISGFNFSEESVNGKNIENLIGSVQIPLGIAGPISIRHAPQATRKYYIPLATTEGALVASVSRGCKAVALSGGASVEIQNVGVTRSPVFKTRGITHSFEIKKWLGRNFGKIAKICESTSSHLKLNTITSSLAGKNLFVRFSFD